MRGLSRRLAQLNLQLNRAGIVGVGDIGGDRTKEVTHLVRHCTGHSVIEFRGKLAAYPPVFGDFIAGVEHLAHLGHIF